MTSVNKANTQDTSRLNKRKGRILSIDYDFFQNANAAEQAMLYPDGHDFANINLRNFIWRARYQTTPALRDITLNKFLLKEIISILQEQKPDTPVTIKNSHVFAYQTVMQLSDELNKPVDVYHIDMHHDLFNEEPFHEKVDCGCYSRKKRGTLMTSYGSEEKRVKSFAPSTIHYQKNQPTFTTTHSTP